ncbi:uncharacterized protein LOC127876907 [Dreissena polymorpha]|uniref:Uncharacterized protein n=1 Tax=Dreissena polymorpha TaxID=45954 RepID=A0A9D4KPH1_DREPO|nr:uncharacterized protein LOC127876907 [Dreissena polymorpha]XP_052278376.1 uncharacterized protein LOC127876907 [Dreissena polymorpha]XP_052278377.1 uncharacterized protein LOC127876907 [Dreissena polymorpha]KAH3843441.1 hypothetical protein DPMN_116959 [Dreissena polymorpha]
MELHVWARFDFSGKLQSVSSTFTQSSEGLCPGVVPLTVPTAGDPGERFVPYTDKKALDRKLDIKIDEMGMLVMQMAELTRKNKAMESLIRKHEVTIASQQRTIERLSTAVYPDVAPGAQKVPSPSVTERKTDVNTSRSFKIPGERRIGSVEGEIVRKSEIDFSVEEHSSTNFSAVANRPSTLNIGFAVSTSHEKKDKHQNYNPYNIDGLLHMRSPKKCESMKEHSDDPNSDGYVKPDGLLQDSYLKFAVHSRDHGTPPPHSSPLFEHSPNMSEGVVGENLDENGYLKLQGKDGGTYATESPAFSADRCFSDDHVIHISNKELKSPVEKWQEVHEYSQSPLAEGSDVVLQPLPDVYTGYIEISDVECTGKNPILPSRRLCQAYTRSDGGTPTCLNKPPSSGLALSPALARLHGSSLTMTQSDGSRSRNPADVSETYSPMVFMGHRHSSPDIRKDDKLNSILKDMRTTAEWNTEKRSLMFNSTECTAPQAEQQLGASVQVLYKAFSNLFIQKGHARIMQYTQSQILKRVLNEIEHTKSHGIDVSEGFSRKCIDLMRVCFRVKTP